MAHPAPPVVSAAPRLWLTRKPGECAFPIGGEGATLISCCNPSARQTYCPAHRRLIRAPTETGERFVRGVLDWLNRQSARDAAP